MKFKIDENLPIEFKDILAQAGIESYTVYDQKLSGCKDSKIFKVCKEEKLALITLDSDFANVKSYPLKTHSGIIIFKTKIQNRDFLIQRLRDVLPLFKKEKIQHALWIVEEERIRIREESA